MSVLEIRHRSGLIETRELSRETPLLAGQLPSNDICIDAEGVAPIHCRISWNRNNFEVAAVGPTGVQLNGVTVRTSVLESGDVLRLGDVDIVMLANGSDAGDQRSLKSVSQAELKQISSDVLPVRSFYVNLPPAEGHRSPRDELPAAISAVPHPADPSPERRVGMSRAVHAAIFEPDGAAPQARPVELRPPSPEPDDRSESRENQLSNRRSGMARVEGLKIDFDALARHETAAPSTKPVVVVHRVRPGEQDPLKSPLVIGLSVGTLLLVLSAATIWFVLSRERAQRQFDTAESQL